MIRKELMKFLNEGATGICRKPNGMEWRFGQRGNNVQSVVVGEVGDIKDGGYVIATVKGGCMSIRGIRLNTAIALVPMGAGETPLLRVAARGVVLEVNLDSLTANMESM